MTTQEEYDLVVYIGRFEPFHIAHSHTVRAGFEISDNVLVLVGSSHAPRSIKNPWTFEERKEFIANTFHDEYYNSGTKNLEIRGIRDYTYNDNAWIENVDITVHEVIEELGAKKVAILGHDKDASSFYLNYFPQWKFIEMPLYPPHGDSVDATHIRKLIFSNYVEFTRGVLPVPVFESLIKPETGFVFSPEFELLKREWKFVEDYKMSWANAPFPPIFTTVDAVVVQSGHILLIQRGEFPGNGLWALPGGFLDVNERIRTAVIRELREETGLKIPPMVLNRAIDAKEIFDDPGRSTRGRTITHAFRITLDPTQKLPKVKGGDDAAHAKWVPLGDLKNMEDVMYEDHFHIIRHMLAKPKEIGMIQ